MRPRAQSIGQDDLFRSRLDQMIDMEHEMVRLGGLIEWPLLETKLGDMYTDAPGQPPSPTRLTAGLAILKHTHNLSDEEPTADVGCRGFARRPDFSNGSCVTKRNRSKRLRAHVLEVEVGPPGSAIRSLIPSHRERLWSKATVVSVAETSGQ